MSKKVQVEFSSTQRKQIQKIILSGVKAKFKILNGKLTEGFNLLKKSAKKLECLFLDLPKPLKSKLFLPYEEQTNRSKTLVLAGLLSLMASLPSTGQVINVCGGMLM